MKSTLIYRWGDVAHTVYFWRASLFLLLQLLPIVAQADLIDISDTVIFAPSDFSAQEQKAVQVLVEEVERRSGVHLHCRPDSDWLQTRYIAVESAEHRLPSGLIFVDAPNKPEGYSLSNEGTVTHVIGHDARGVLYGVGRLLRELRMERGKISIPSNLNISTSPDTPLRGHQLGYRPKTNSYDAWTAEMWEQYIRDLAIFGTNAIEILPPKSDDAADSPHFPLPPMGMMKRMSQICADYGLDVWIWYPALDGDYARLEVVEKSLQEWGSVLSQLPRVDALFVPGGDPGHTEPTVMMSLLEKQTENLHKYHPNAQMWMSPQGFNKEWMDTFIHYMQTEQPKWLTGIVFGPQNRMQLTDLREQLPKQYPIRHYPDITHSMQCQFPVPEWDYVFPTTLQRECINPRPTQFQSIFHLFNPLTIGFLSYSEGCNDDINKILWSGWGWDNDAKPLDILRDYARYFISPAVEDDFANGIMNLERNWIGPIESNDGILQTLAQFQQMEKNATPQMKLNWRFQQALYRAYYDAYDYRRARHESGLQDEALDCLRKAPRVGAAAAIAQAKEKLAKADTEPVAQELRQRVFELAEALYQSIGMQLSVEKFGAIHVDRGANLDLIDVPLNDRVWLEKQVDEITARDTDVARMRAVDALLNRTNPGPGGYYDNLGVPGQQPHLVMACDKYADPEYKSSVLMGRTYYPEFPTFWNTYAETRYETPIQLHYDSLDATAQYTVRVVYAGDSEEIKMRMEADGQQVHDFIDKPWPPKPIDFDVPRDATSDGNLTLSFTQPPGRGGNGRGCQVAEVWLIKMAEQ